MSYDQHKRMYIRHKHPEVFEETANVNSNLNIVVSLHCVAEGCGLNVPAA